MCKIQNKQMILDILELNRRLCYDLWLVASEKNKGYYTLQSISPRIIFPYKRNGDIRVSEQEARFLMCSILNSMNYFYSVETPTKKKYHFNGGSNDDNDENKRSACTDLTLWTYEGSSFKRCVNIEFKSHNPPKDHIAKDIEKLVCEEITGNWFHLFKNIDSGTLKSLFEKLKESFKDVLKRIHHDIDIVFTICVLEKKWACQNILNSNSDLDDFFNLEYKVSNNIVKVQNLNKSGWIIIESDIK
jgi:hypothetical protein